MKEEIKNLINYEIMIFFTSAVIVIISVSLINVVWSDLKYWWIGLIGFFILGMGCRSLVVEYFSNYFKKVCNIK